LTVVRAIDPSEAILGGYAYPCRAPPTPG
jgi:hypothetical protein